MLLFFFLFFRFGKGAQNVYSATAVHRKTTTGTEPMTTGRQAFARRRAHGSGCRFVYIIGQTYYYIVIALRYNNTYAR